MGGQRTRLEPGQVAGLLDRIVDTVADPIFVKDEEHRWIVVNDAFCDFMGQPREAILGKSDFDFFPRSEAETFWRKDEEVFASGEVNINEEPFTDAGGRTHTIITKKAVFTDDHGARILVGVIRDVTDLKDVQRALERAHADLERRVEQRTREVEDTQARLRQAQKMEAVGQLTGGIAHDFNNLLAVVMGNLEMMLRRHGAHDGMRRLAVPALEATRRGATLTQRLLAFSRQQTLKPRPTDVRDLVDSMLELLRRALGEAIAIEVDGGVGPRVAAVDATQLETAILNLAINARDAMPRGGTLRIRVDAVELCDRGSLEGLAPGRYVLLEVADSGQGMAPGVLERVFEPFFTTKGDEQGSGLGLSMVYGFIRQSRGHVSASSSPGRGTVFRVLLPEVPDRPGSAPPRAAGGSDVPIGQRERILVVEDDPAVRSMTVALLRSLGYEVSEAATQGDALDRLEEMEELHLLLTDVVLAGGGRGDHVAAAVELQRPGVPVLFMSGYAHDVLGERARGRDFRLLTKPFQLHQLARAVRAVLDGD